MGVPATEPFQGALALRARGMGSDTLRGECVVLGGLKRALDAPLKKADEPRHDDAVRHSTQVVDYGHFR
jgi:hypothetical protein